jgi:hypothetical protein
MSGGVTGTIRRVATIGVVLLGLVIAAYGVNLLLVGVTVVSLPAVPVGTPPGPASTETIPIVMGVILTIAGGLILVGLAVRRTSLTWIGAAVSTLFAGVYVFSIGGILVPVAAVLLALLSVVSWTRANRASPSSTY